jgi:hypothetical protein
MPLTPPRRLGSPISTAQSVPAAELVLHAVAVAAAATVGSPAATAARDQARAAVDDLPSGCGSDLLALICDLLELLARFPDPAALDQAIRQARSALAGC